FAAIALFLLVFLLLWALIYSLLPPVWRTAQTVWASLARAILRRQRFAVWYERGVARLQPLHPYRTLVVILGVGFVVAGLTGATFLLLAELMQRQNAYLE